VESEKKAATASAGCSLTPPENRRPEVSNASGFFYAVFRNTSAEFFEPKAMQLQMACSISTVLPGSGT
jgi:hypothetical protein